MERPVYLQIIRYIKRGAVAGTIRDGDELPSRRVLSALLGINPNTVQKAFHLLEEEQLIESRTGAKSCMTLPEKTLAALRQELLSEELRNAARTLRQMGITEGRRAAPARAGVGGGRDMKKQLSVFALHARAAIGRLALVLLGMLALDAAAYVLFGLRGFRASLTGSELVTALRVIFSLGLVACQLLLASCFGAGSRYGYTLRRLQIPETRVLLWSGVCNALCFACVWCVQLMASVGTAALHAADARYAEGAQGIFVDFYRSDFLHGCCRWRTGICGCGTWCSCWRSGY